jgi:hypothetical protein
MKLTNDNYIILIGTKNFTERYYREKAGWLKVSAHGRAFRMTAEQVLNHVLPAVASIKSNLTITHSLSNVWERVT